MGELSRAAASGRHTRGDRPGARHDAGARPPKARLIRVYLDSNISDAIHAATALRHGISLVVSADDDFDAIPGIERIDPLDSARLAALMSE